MRRFALTFILLLAPALPAYAGPLAMKISASQSSVRRIAPFPIVLECVSASTMDDDHWWSMADVTWTVDDGGSGAVSHPNLTSPVDGGTRYWNATGSPGHKPIRGRTIGFVVENVAATITVTATVRSASGATASDAFTIASAGAPNVPYLLRDDRNCHWIRVGPDLRDGGGRGTRQDPRTHPSLLHAAANIHLFKANHIELAKGAVFTINRNVTLDRPNTVITSFGADGAAAPVLAQGADVSLVHSVAPNVAQNMLIRGITFRPVAAVNAAKADAVDVNANNLGVVDCTFEGEPGGAGFWRAVGHTHEKDGFLCLNTSFGITKSNTFPLEVTRAFVAGVRATGSTTEMICRVLNRGDKQSQYLNFFCCDLRQTTEQKLPLRLQATEHADVIDCHIVGPIQMGTGTKNGSNEYTRVDGCHVELPTTLVDSCFSIFSQTAQLVICNVVADIKGPNNKFADFDASKDSITAHSSGIRVAHCTIIGDATNTGGTSFVRGWPPFTVADIEVVNCLMVAPAGYRGAVLNLSTDAAAMEKFHDNVGPAVGHRFAKIDDADLTLAEFQSRGYAWERGSAREDIDPASLINWRTDNPRVVAGAPTPPYVHHDVYFNDRTARSRIGAADAAPAGAAATSPAHKP